MTYHWDPAGMNAPLVLSRTVAENGLKLADDNQLRVLLWLSWHHLEWNAGACAEALGLPQEVCESSLTFWVQQGALCPVDTAQSQQTAPMARPAAVKPRVQEVLAYQKKHPHFADFLQQVSAILGKAIGHGDTATLLYLIDTVGLPENVLIQEIGYAVSIGKPNMRYIEKLALDWADKDLTTFEAVDEYIHMLERWRNAAARVEALLQLPRPLTIPQSEMAAKWLERWQFSEEMLQRAAAMATEKTGKFNPGYMDKLLETWHTEGIDNPQKIPTAASVTRKKTPAATNPEESGLDTDSFDEQLLRYRPKFDKKGE